MTFKEWWVKKEPAIKSVQLDSYETNATMTLLKIYFESAYQHGKAEGEK